MQSVRIVLMANFSMAALSLATVSPVFMVKLLSRQTQFALLPVASRTRGVSPRGLGTARQIGAVATKLAQGNIANSTRPRTVTAMAVVNPTGEAVARPACRTTPGVRLT